MIQIIRLCVIGLITLGLLTQSSVLQAQQPAEKIDLQAINRIKDEEAQRSQVMEIVGYLTDVTGGRLTGSPNLKRAQQYALDRMREWGISNPHPEAWTFGRGWSLAGFSASMISPTFSSLIAYPKAWSPSTNGPVRGEPILLDVKSPDDLAKYKGKLNGKIVLLTGTRAVPPEFTPPPQRLTDDELQKLANAKPTGGETFRMTPEIRARQELNYQRWKMIYDEGAAVVLEPGGGRRRRRLCNPRVDAHAG